ncbi:MAG: hypothetical protein COA78_19715 [Blastopirellula sp.]|nr:MAG: hypothetical protein COA78_19715 [Blastopirellula sp.]
MNKPRIRDLVKAFRETEQSTSRGPSFKKVALALEEEMKCGQVTKQMLLDCFGPPNLFDDHSFVYLFDHHQPGNSNEWYFHMKDDILVNSGYNVCGINDLSDLKIGSKFLD